MQVCVGTYNIKNGSMVGHDYRALADDIRACGADICGLQEVDQFTTRNQGGDTMAAFAAASGLHVRFSRAIDYRGGAYGDGILSRYPIESFDVIPLPGGSEDRSFGHAVLLLPDGRLDFFNTHLELHDRLVRARQFVTLAEAIRKCSRWVLTGDFNTDDTREFAAVGDAVIVNDAWALTYAGQTAIDNILFPAGTRVLARGMGDDNGHSDHRLLWATAEL